MPSTATRLFHGDTAAEALFDRAIERLERMGGRAVEIDYRPLHAAALMLYDDAFIARRYANLEPVYAEWVSSSTPPPANLLSWGARYSGADVFKAQYRLAGYRKQALRLCDEVDLLRHPHHAHDLHPGRAGAGQHPAQRGHGLLHQLREPVRLLRARRPQRLPP